MCFLYKLYKLYIMYFFLHVYLVLFANITLITFNIPTNIIRYRNVYIVLYI